MTHVRVFTASLPSQGYDDPSVVTAHISRSPSLAITILNMPTHPFFLHLVVLAPPLTTSYLAEDDIFNMVLLLTVCPYGHLNQLHDISIPT